FARRFCREWNTEPPAVFFKSADGALARDENMALHPSGRSLPLLALLDVLQDRAGPETLHTEAAKVLETHRVVELIRTSAPRVAPPRAPVRPRLSGFSRCRTAFHASYPIERFAPRLGCLSPGETCGGSRVDCCAGSPTMAATANKKKIDCWTLASSVLTQSPRI